MLPNTTQSGLSNSFAVRCDIDCVRLTFLIRNIMNCVSIHYHLTFQFHCLSTKKNRMGGWLKLYYLDLVVIV